MPDTKYGQMTAEAFNRALGEELKRARECRGWSRAELVDRMSSSISAQALATYEQGTRQCTVARFVEICQALGVAAPEVIGLALQRLEADLEVIGGVRVDLHAVTRDRRPELRSLRRWARLRLQTDPDSDVVNVDQAAIHEIAVFLGYTRAKLVGYLAMFPPRSAGQMFGT
jgi:transcriptional regulator with XRE-family HTH domain